MNSLTFHRKIGRVKHVLPLGHPLGFSWKWSEKKEHTRLQGHGKYVVATKIFSYCQHKNKTKRALFNNWHKWFVETSPTFMEHRAAGRKRRAVLVLVTVSGTLFKSLPPTAWQTEYCHSYYSFQELDNTLDGFTRSLHVLHVNLNDNVHIVCFIETRCFCRQCRIYLTPSGFQHTMMHDLIIRIHYHNYTGKFVKLRALSF